MERQIQNEREEIAFWEKLFESMISILEKILEWLDLFLHGGLEMNDQEKVRGNIEESFVELANMYRTMDLELTEAR